MKQYSVVFAPQAQDQLVALYRYIAKQGSSVTADRYTEAVVACCEALATFPNRGVSREDVRAGLRLTHYRGRTMIAFFVDEARQEVAIVGVFHGGQDYESALAEDGG